VGRVLRCREVREMGKEARKMEMGMTMGAKEMEMGKTGEDSLRRFIKMPLNF
jgi:hypothetical protein